ATQVPYDILEKKDSTGYIVFGSLFPQSLSWAQTVEIDTSLNIINIDSLPNKVDTPLTAKWLSDTTYIVSGLYIWPGSSPQDDDITVKVLDTANNIQYEKFFGRKDTSDYPAWRTALDFIDKSAIYVGGQRPVNSFSNTTTYLQLYLLDSTLKVRGKKFYGNDASYRLYGVLATSDGGCIMYASRYDYLTQDEEKDIYLLKVMEDSIAVSTSSKPVIKPKEVMVYPNPGINTLCIATALKNIQFEMYDINGEKILSKEIENSNTSFDVSKMPSGIYLYKIYNSKKVYETGKWVKK
ncbi:MAG: T9SS type A sorting domain-containing protein, partial [Bacteroidota bacterium]|nr:T9SS type A sorting domain-containing protein [Bacteroidota bacterium]